MDVHSASGVAAEVVGCCLKPAAQHAGLDCRLVSCLWLTMVVEVSSGRGCVRGASADCWPVAAGKHHDCAAVNPRHTVARHKCWRGMPVEQGDCTLVATRSERALLTRHSLTIPRHSDICQSCFRLMAGGRWSSTAQEIRGLSACLIAYVRVDALSMCTAWPADDCCSIIQNTDERTFAMLRARL